MTPFDPYHKWLGILPHEHPVNHYRLLGIAPFESNADVIDNATELRLSYLRTMRIGAYALYSEQLIGEVERARDVLLDPTKRIQYEQLLRERLGGVGSHVSALAAAAPPAMPVAFVPPMPLSPPGVTPRQTLAEPANLPQAIPDIVAYVPDSVPLKRRHVRRGSNRRLVYNIALGGVLGLVVGYLILCNLRPQADFLGIFPRSQTARPDSTVASSEPDVGLDMANDDVTDERSKLRSSNSRIRPNPSSDSRARAVRPVDPFAGLPGSVELPQPFNTAEITIVEFPTPVAGPVMMRLESVAKLPANQTFFMRRSSDAQHFDIGLEMDPGDVIARLSQRGGAVYFRWQPASALAPVLGQLRNSVLQLESGGFSKSIGLRKAVEQPAIRVSLAKSSLVHPVVVEATPSPSSLRVAVGDLSQFPVKAGIKDNTRSAGLGKPIVVALEKLNDADYPHIEIVFLAGDEGLRLELRPRLATPDKIYELTLDVVEERKKWLALRRPVVTRELEAITSEGKSVEARIAKIKARSPRSQSDRALQAQELPKLRDRLDVLNAKYKVAMEQKNQLDRAERGIPPVEELVRKLHESAVIPFRVFFLVGEVELDLVRSEGYAP
jgi:hypothetical protein